MKKYAYVSLLFGDGSYVPGALLLGYMLKYILKLPEDRILMVTPDISKYNINKLKLFWKITKVDYIYAPNIISSFVKRKEFHKMFTKYNCLKLTNYYKILFLDLDYLPISRKIRKLFNLNTPATTFLNQPSYITNNYKIPYELIKKNNYDVSFGLMLLKPDSNQFNKIIYKMKKYNGPKFMHPEQQYLGYTIKTWYGIDIKYHCSRWEYLCNEKKCYGITITYYLKPWFFSLDIIKTLSKKKEIYGELQCIYIWHKIFKIFLNDNTIPKSTKYLATSYYKTVKEIEDASKQYYYIISQNNKNNNKNN